MRVSIVVVKRIPFFVVLLNENKLEPVNFKKILEF